MTFGYLNNRSGRKSNCFDRRRRAVAWCDGWRGRWDGGRLAIVGTVCSVGCSCSDRRRPRRDSGAQHKVFGVSKTSAVEQITFFGFHELFVAVGEILVHPPLHRLTVFVVVIVIEPQLFVLVHRPRVSTIPADHNRFHVENRKEIQVIIENGKY